jgi:hypothetical protein
MNTLIVTAAVCLLVAFTFAGVIVFAIHRKPHVRAGGRFRGGEFYIEATDREGR